VLRLALAWLLTRPVQVLAVLGLAVGLTALLVVLAVMNGLIAQDRAGVRGPLSDLLLIPATESEAPSWERYRQALEARPEVAAVAPHLVAYAVLALEGGAPLLARSLSSDINGVQLVGIDPEDEMRATGFREALLAARVAPPADPEQPFSEDPEDPFARPPVLVSDDLAEILGLRRGEILEFGTLPPRLPPPGAPLEPHNGRFRLAGTYATGDYGVDMDRVYLRRDGFGSLRYDLLGEAAGEFNEVLIRLAPGVDYVQGKAAVLAALREAGLPEPGGPGGGALETWEERRALFLTAIDNERRVTTLVLFFIVVVAAFGLFATVGALVREKVRDLGILAAVGYTPWRRGGLLLLVGALGSAAGTLLGYVLARLLVARHEAVEAFLEDRLGIVIFPHDLYVVQGLPALWVPEQARFLALLAFLTGVLFTALPALRAALLSPVEALRYE